MYSCALCDVRKKCIRGRVYSIFIANQYVNRDISCKITFNLNVSAKYILKVSNLESDLGKES